MGRVEEEEDEGPIIYRRRRALSVQPSQRPMTVLMMDASSSTTPFSLDLYHNGYFKVKHLTYIDSEMVTVNIDVTGFKFEDMKEYVKTKTHSVVTGLYYFNKDHKNANLGDYIGKDLGDYILVELKLGYDFDNSDDEFSDVTSLDHLSEGKEELRQVRIKKRKSVEEKSKSIEEVNDESRIVFHNKDAYDESRLVLHNDSDDNDCEVDPLFSNLDDDSKKDKVHVEPEINSDEDMPIMDEDEIVYDPNKRDYPIYDPNIHWKLKKPILGEFYVDLDQVKDCLTFYSVANGYQLWYEKSDSEKLLVRCGFDEKERRKKKLPRDPNKPCCPFRLRSVKMHDGNSWHIRTLVDEHTCTRQYNLGCLVTSKWIARQYEDKIRMNPDLKVIDLQEMQNVGSQYDRLVDYAGELRKTNPGTTVNLCIDPLADEEIKTASAGAYQYLVDKDPCTWSRAYFKEGTNYDVVENGLSESFNSHIKNARRKPIIGMLEDIRSYVMTRNYTLRKECEDWKSKICPNIRKVLELHKKIQRKKDKSEMKIQKHVARPPRSMTCNNCGETGHNKNGCEKPKVPGEQANPPNEQVRINSVTTRGGIWDGEPGVLTGEGESASGFYMGREVVDKYMLFDEDDLVDVQIEEEVDTREENVVVGAENVGAENVAAEEDEKEDEAARLKKRMRHI
ncbi:cellulose synthase [Tanacetum coccineum]